MMYEDLRSLTDVHYRRIKKLEAIEKFLRDQLEKETTLKNRYNRLFTDKDKECKELSIELSDKSTSLEEEIKAHSDLKYQFTIREERIKVLNKDIEDGKRIIEDRNS